MSDELAKLGIGVVFRSFTRRMILKNARIIWIATPALAIFTGLAVLSPPLLAQTAIDWSATAQGMAIGTQKAFYCAPNPAKNNVRATWGTDAYTSDSGICGSAVHAGLIGFGSGGAVTIQITAGQQSYAGTSRNGVTSVGWGSWPQSFVFVASRTGNTGGGGSLNFFQNALILGVQIGFVQAVTSSNLETNPSYLSQVVPTMPSYAAALGLPHDQLDTLIGQLRSGATQAGLTVMNVWNQFQQQLTNRTCMCGNYAANLKTAYSTGWSLGLAEMEAFLGSAGDYLTPLVSGARASAAAVGLPTDGLDSVISRLQNGAKGCDVAQDLQNIEKQFEQLTNQPCTCMQDANASSGSQTSPTTPGPMQPQPQPQGQGTCGSVIYQNNGTIFGGSDGHPLVVRPPGGLQARVVHLEVPANTYLNLDAVMVFDSSGTNVALNKPASQSSRSPWTQPNGAQGAVDGHTPDGGYHIHTDQNGNPSWWEVDLQQVYAIAEIRVYNRMDYRDRAAHLKICVNYQPSSNASGTMNPSGTASSSLAGTKWAFTWIIYPWVDSTGKLTLTINADGTATTSAKSGDGRSTYSAQWWGCAVAGDQLQCKFNEHLDQPDNSADRTGTVTCTSSWDAQAGGWYLKVDYAFDMPPKINWKVAPASTPLNNPTMSVTLWRFPLG